MNEKENVAPITTNTYFLFLHTQLQQLYFFQSMNNNLNNYHWIQHQIQQEYIFNLQQKQQQHLYPIFNNQKSNLHAKPQTPKVNRKSGRAKKNTPALNE